LDFYSIPELLQALRDALKEDPQTAAFKQMAQVQQMVQVQQAIQAQQALLQQIPQTVPKQVVTQQAMPVHCKSGRL
jgi:hypothetical protein